MVNFWTWQKKKKFTSHVYSSLMCIQKVHLSLTRSPSCQFIEIIFLFFPFGRCWNIKVMKISHWNYSHFQHIKQDESCIKMCSLMKSKYKEGHNGMSPSIAWALVHWVLWELVQWVCISDLHGTGVRWAFYLAVLGEKTKARSEAGCLSSSYLIPPAPILQVLPSAHPERRRKEELDS